MGLHGDAGVTRGYRGLQEVTKGYKGFQGVTGGYRGLQGARRSLDTIFWFILHKNQS